MGGTSLSHRGTSTGKDVYKRQLKTAISFTRMRSWSKCNVLSVRASCRYFCPRIEAEPMVDTFEIIEKPEICQFSENLGKMIIRNKNSSLTCIYMTVRLDDATICDKLTLYYDAEILITINLRDIVHTLLECEFPRQTGVTDFTYLYITLTDTATTKTYRCLLYTSRIISAKCS